MTTDPLAPLAAFDIVEGRVTAVTADWPAPQGDAGYRWLHLDLTRAATMRWAHQHLPPIAAHALTQAETRPRCDRLEDGLILNLRGVNLNPGADPEDMVSLRVWVTERAIVTARMRKVWAADAIRQAVAGGHAPPGIGAFLVDLVTGLTNRIETVSLELEDRTDTIEDTVLDGARPPDGDMANLRQAVIKIRRFIHPQRDAVAGLAQLDDALITRQDRAQLREASNRTRRIVEEMDATRERLQALQDQLDADRAQALGRHSHILSIVAAIFLPLGFLTGLFGVNVAGMPGLDTPHAFWLVAGGSLAIGLLLYAVFRLADWL